MSGRDLAGGGDLTVDAIGGVLSLTLTGSVDEERAATLTSCFERAIASGRPVVVDLSDADVVGDEAVESLRAGYRRLGTRLHLVCPRGGPAWATLRAAGVAHLFIVHPSRAAAMSAAAPR